MYRLFLLLLIALPLPCQTSAPNPDKPPQDVDDALRARIKQFYDYHVARKYRQAEQVIAEESKDDFYVLSKPEMERYTIGPIEYSEKFTKAKVVIVGAMMVLLPTMGGKIMDMPFASYWKIEKGVWCWYYNKDAARHTPFGDVKEPAPGSKPTALPAAPDISIAALQSALRIDRTSIELADGKPQIIKVTNTLPGPASLSVVCPLKPLVETGITATLDNKNLKGSETASLTLSVDSHTPLGVVPLQIIVSPTNQILNLTVRISAK